MDSLPEALRGSENFKKFLDPATNDLSVSQLAQSYDHLQQAAGWPADQIVRMPKQDDAAGWDAFYARMGRPEAPDKYAINGLDLKNDGDKAFVESFRAEAHKAGVTQAQMDVMMGHLGKSLAQFEADDVKQVTDHRATATAELKAAWGSKYDTQVNEIPATVEWLATKAGLIDASKPPEVQAQAKADLIKALNVGGEADNPSLMRLFGVLNDLRAELGSLPGTGKAVDPKASTSRTEAETRKAERYADPDWLKALHDSSNPRHKQAVEERNDLNRIISEAAA